MSESKPRVLVVDDNETNRYASCRILEAAGFATLEAATGRDALRLSATRPALIVLDVNLPDLSGFEVCRKIKASPLTSSIPVLHMSAKHTRTEDKAQGLEGGADSYLVQPVEAIELVATVRALLRARRAEEEAMALASEWQVTFDALGEGVCRLNSGGRITRWNRALSGFLCLGQRNDADLSGKTLRSYLPESSLLSFDEAIAGKRREVSDIEIGQGVYCLTCDPLLDTFGERTGTACTLTDVSRRMMVESELKRATALAEGANRAKSAFLANMSHEIRTPLGAVLGLAELACNPQTREAERQSFADSIRRNGNILKALINDVLDLSKVEAGHVDVELLPIGVATLADEVVETWRQPAAQQGTRLTLTVGQEVPATFVSDPTRVRQVLSNLIGNAVKFTSGGAVRIAVSGTPSGDGVRFHVNDTGIGISVEQRERLFQPFSQADTSTTRRFGGTGLGLALSRKLAVLLRGDVWLESSVPGAGSTFCAEFFDFVDSVSPDSSRRSPVPAETATDGLRSAQTLSEPTMTQAAPLPAAVSSSLAIKDVRVLVVDDFPDNQLVIKLFLARGGASVVVRDNAADAIKCAMEGSFDVVLMDIQMPGTDGREAVGILRRLGYSKPVLALSAHALEDERARSLAAGFDDHLTKPVEAAKLIAAVSHFANRIVRHGEHKSPDQGAHVTHPAFALPS